MHNQFSSSVREREGELDGVSTYTVCMWGFVHVWACILMCVCVCVCVFDCLLGEKLTNKRSRFLTAWQENVMNMVGT